MSSPDRLKHHSECPECTGCGRCCYMMIDKQPMWIADPEELKGTIEYYEGLNMKLYHWKGNLYYGAIRRKCKHLDMKTKKCTNYENRPWPCRTYPDQYLGHMAHWCPLMKRLRKEGKL